MSLGRRWAITLLVPVVLLFLAKVPLPGVDSNAVAALGGRAETFGVLAVGLAPFLGATWLVELVAFLVPGLSHLRHGGPEARKKLEGWSLRLGFVLAVAQGISVATMLRSASDSAVGPDVYQGHGVLGTIAVVVALGGGLALQLVLASLVSRQRLVNGIVLLVTVGLARDTLSSLVALAGLGPGRSGTTSLHALPPVVEPFAALATVVVAITVAVATWLVTRPRPPVPLATETKANGPYRDAERLATEPALPVPASSIQVYPFAMSILGMPALLGSLKIPGASALADAVERGFVPLGLLAVVGATFVFAWVLHRPKELAALSRSLLVQRGPSPSDASAALRRAMPATLVYLVGVFVASSAMRGHLSAFDVALLTALVADLVRAAQVASQNPDWVPVWDERRAAAIPVGQAALSADGIRHETTGTRTLALLQVFAPYAPATILVPRADAERAVAVLRHVLAGGESPAPRAEAVAPAPLGDEPTKIPVLPIAVTFGVGAFVAAFAAHPPSSPKVGPRAELEIVHVDDDSDPLGAVSADDVPVPGVTVMVERVGGTKRARSVHYARIPCEPSTCRAAKESVGPWLATLPKPEGTRFGFEDVFDYDLGRVVGVRTFLLGGPPALTTADVKEATVMLDPVSGEPLLSVGLTSDGGARFADVTGQWIDDRAAIVVDGKIMSAPIIRSRIPGGRLTVTLGQEGTLESRLAEAKRLAAALAP